MNFYVSRYSFQYLNIFLNFKGCSVLDVNKSRKKFQNIQNKTHFTFLLNEEINNKIFEIYKKKNHHVLYINSDLNIDCIKNIKENIEKMELYLFKKIILIDTIEENTDKPQEILNYVDELLCVPSDKKVKIIQCENDFQFITLLEMILNKLEDKDEN